MTCTFENAKQDTITVVKRTVGGDGTFAFASATLGSFSLTTSNGTASRSFPGLAAGTYAIAETVPAGWVQSSATCDNGDAPGSITLTAGKTVTCTFESARQDAITVVKRTLGGDGAFAFTSPNAAIGNFSLTTSGGTASKTFTGLAAGTYAITETVPVGWTQTSATCSDGSNPASITLTVGETVTCTFENRIAVDIPTLTGWELLLLSGLLGLMGWCGMARLDARVRR